MFTKKNKLFNLKSLQQFNAKIYIELNTDLKDLTELQAKLHYENYGHKENRKYKYENIPVNFNEKIYIELNTDLKDLTELQAKLHYENDGYKENRKYKYENIPVNFNEKIYIELNEDLKDLTELQAKLHYENYGYKENRKYQYENIPDDFNWEKYVNNYADLKSTINTKEKAINHWIYYGKNEERTYYTFENNKIYDETIKNYYDAETINEFINIYKYTKNDIFTDSKIEFRFFCFRYLNYIKQIELPNINLNSKYEAVLIEFRCFPHLEFTIRNTIHKLGKEWSHTIICGNLNFNYINSLCKNINKNIKIIKLDYDNINASEYSKILASEDFWNLFIGEKILIYQEDSCIFKSNINDFLKWDYIGAPWPYHQNDNENGVGNGGFSLRSKNIMIKIIKLISIENTIFEKSTVEYMKNSNLYIAPEDVYFSLNIIRYKCGEIPNREIASEFSTEYILNNNSLGGHNFWINDKNWKKRLYDNIVIQFKPTFGLYYNKIFHRGGWKDILYNLCTNDFFNHTSNIYFFDTIEMHFLKKEYVCNKPWIGIIHWTPNLPNYLSNYDIEIMFNNKNFIESLKYCKGLITLSDNLMKYVKNKIQFLNLNIKLLSIKHPIDNNVINFNLHKFYTNPDKKLIQIGQQLRKLTSIYVIKNISYKKIWFTGNKSMIESTNMLKKYIDNNNIKNINYDDVLMYYTKTIEEYDEFLEKNIVFIDLIDAAANNVVIECIIRNTPIIVNKIPGVVDYLGENYPLYFNNLDDIPELLNYENIINAYIYLNKIDKNEFNKKLFMNKIINFIN